MHHLLTRGLAAPSSRWPPLQAASGWVQQAAHIASQWGAIPGVVVRGPARILATLVTRLHPFGPAELCPSAYQAWRDLRRQLSYWEENRRKQWRFRRDPAAYLAQIEGRLLQ